MSQNIPPGTDLSKIPLAANPNGNPPNFADPPSQEVIAKAVGLPLAIIAFLFVLLRLISNFKMARKLSLDDRR
jgi:hypothetical protein